MKCLKFRMNIITLFLYKTKKKNFLKLLKKYWKTDQYPKEYWSKVSESKIVGFSKDVKKIVSRATKVNKKI